MALSDRIPYQAAVDRDLQALPDKAKVLAHLRAIKTYLDTNKQTPAGDVVHELTPVIRGWSTYYRHACSAETFSYADHRIWRMLWQWAKRRHPKKSAACSKTRTTTSRSCKVPAPRRTPPLRRAGDHFRGVFGGQSGRQPSEVEVVGG